MRGAMRAFPAFPIAADRGGLLPFRGFTTEGTVGTEDTEAGLPRGEGWRLRRERVIGTEDA